MNRGVRCRGQGSRWISWRRSQSLLAKRGVARVLLVRYVAALALAILLAAGGACALAPQQELTPAPPSVPVTQSPEQLYQSLSAVRVDASQVYTVHNLTLRREGVALTFADGKIGFLQPLDGRVTGAVFLGTGRIFVLPPYEAERASMARFLHVPLLDTEFRQIYMRFDDDTAEEIRRDLMEQKIEATDDPTFSENWNPAVAQFNRGNSVRILEDWLSSAPRPYFFAGIDSTGVGAFDVLVDERRLASVLIGQPQQSNGSLYFDVWTWFSPPNTSPWIEEFSPVDFSIDTTIHDDLSLAGNTTVHLKAQAGGDRVLELELSRFLRVEKITDATGQALAFFQNQEIRRRDVARQGNDLLFVVLPAPVTTGEDIFLHISYSGTVIADAGNGVYFVGARGSWYPHLAGPDRFAKFDLKFRWPKHLTLVATGQHQESGEDASTRSGSWQSTQPVAVAGFNLGDYQTQTIEGPPYIQLFADTQLEAAIVGRLRENAAIDAASHPTVHPPDIAPMPPILPNPGSVLKQLGGKIRDSIQFYEGLDGPFPYPELDVSQIPGSFGQGWPGLLYLPTFVFLPRLAQEQAGLGVNAQEQIQQIVPFHEVAHQWWGNVVVPASYRDSWLEEAMANYHALLYDENRNPGKHDLSDWLARYRDALLANLPGIDAPADSGGPLDFGYRLDSSKTPDAYNIIVYDKGTWVIHMLRMMLRDPEAKNPDERFDTLLRSVLEEHRFQTLSTAQFEQDVEKVMTPSMDLEDDRTLDWFFDQWVHSTGIPDYSLTFRVRPRGERFEVEGTLEQSGVSRTFTESVPIYEQGAQAKSERLGDVVTTGPETHFSFLTRFRPERLLIDPEHTILCQTK
jgi:Peptidase family M1 domain